MEHYRSDNPRQQLLGTYWPLLLPWCQKGAVFLSAEEQVRIPSFLGGQSTCYRARARKKFCFKTESFLDLIDLEGENLASSLEGEETSLFLLSP